MSVPSGAIDVHVHTGPSLFDRTHDAVSLAKVLARAGSGAVYKSHFGNTFEKVELAQAAVPSAELYSSVTLNGFVGGFNETAVRHALETGTKVVWLPTLDAANFDVGALGRAYPFPKQNLSVLKNGVVTNSVRDILTTIADFDGRIVLGNGHVSREETFAVLDAIDEMGLELPYLITHADFEFMGLDAATQATLADRGAVLEKCYLPVVHGDVTADAFVKSIRRIGVDRCVLSTDHGAAGKESPLEAYASVISTLRERGLSPSSVKALTVENPRQLLGVD